MLEEITHQQVHKSTVLFHAQLGTYVIEYYIMQRWTLTSEIWHAQVLAKIVNQTTEVDSNEALKVIHGDNIRS
jgi:hypothetical protein